MRDCIYKGTEMRRIVIYNMSNNPNHRPFGCQQDSESRSAREAYRTAKDSNRVPRSQSPLGHPKNIPDRRNPGQYCTEYEHVNTEGKPVTIRRDNPVDYGDAFPKQGPHYNAGPSGSKLKQHHNYPKK